MLVSEEKLKPINVQFFVKTLHTIASAKKNQMRMSSIMQLVILFDGLFLSWDGRRPQTLVWPPLNFCEQTPSTYL